MKEELDQCLEVLKQGGLILYPTDTIWGIGCDATNEEAVAKIYALKKRSDAKSLISIVSTDAMLQRFVVEIPEIAWDIIDLSDKPTTMIYPKARNIARNAVAEDGSIGIRLIRNGFAHQLAHRFNKAIISTSANISNEPSPALFTEISEEIKSGVDYVVDPQFDSGTHSSSSILKIGLKGEIAVIRK
ncbi:MAG: threonylcarbamoyl-AMP synthase [Flavobacteriales bacterium]|nr:threonylcarbamoyl-AMP synthase [Flavobacteriales bacterium]